VSTPQEIRRRMSESLAFLASYRQVWESAQEAHANRIEKIQADCPHENVSAFSGQYTLETTCCDCGKFLGA
jgi:hypothetical protein